MPKLQIVEVVILLAFFAWCVGAFLFLRYFARRGKKSAAEPEAGRKKLDAIIAKVRETTDARDSNN